MIVESILVSLEEFDLLRKDRSYTKLEVRERRNHSLKKGIRLKRFYKTTYNIKLNFIANLLRASNDDSLPNHIKEKFGGFHSYAIEHDGCLKPIKFKELLNIEAEYKLNLSIPKKFRTYIINNY